MIDQQRRLVIVGAGLDLGPEPLQEADIGAQFVFGCALGGGADNESAVAVFALADDDALQPLTLLFGSDFARDAGVVDGGHVDQEAAGQRDVAGDPRPFLADGLFGNLNQNFLAFLQQVRDLGNGLVFPAAEAASAAASARARTAVAVKSRALGALGVGGGACGSADFGAGFDGAVTPGFGIEQSFGFRLRFLELSFDLGGVIGLFFPGRRLPRLWRRGASDLNGSTPAAEDSASRFASGGDFTGRLAVVIGGASFLFHLLKDGVFLEVFHVVRQVGFFFLDFFFLQSSGGSGGARRIHRGPIRMARA